MLRLLVCSFAKDTKGVVAIIWGLLIPAIIGFVALGVEVGLWYSQQRDYQTAADAAALAAAYTLSDGGSVSNISAAATEEASNNGFTITGNNTLAVNTPPQTGAYMGDTAYIEVVLTSPSSPLIAGLFLSSDVNISARAVAWTAGGAGDGYCFMSLNTTNEKAFHLHNNVDLPPECGVYVNSDYCSPGSSGALFIDNNSTIAGTTSVAGCVFENSPQAEVTGALTEGADQLSDPYVDRQDDIRDDITANTAWSPSSCDVDTTGNSTETLSPGYYTDCVFKGNGTINLDPGIYYIDSKLTVEGNVDVFGTGVTFVLLEETDLDFGNNGDLNITAPTSGIYEGLAFVGHPDMNSSKQVVFHNSIGFDIDGALYFPNQTIELSNRATATGGCALFVSDYILMHNNVDISNNCQAADDETLSLGGGSDIILVE
ncbi:MAG: hypothetical protein COB59_11880 [Rhodospirillaceae bacterium]|nr:MAG: hypothetical protein COB59_11880 [Rhodospirillaceae bacterium]